MEGMFEVLKSTLDEGTNSGIDFSFTDPTYSVIDTHRG